jgi:hypothetical protein
MRLLYSKEVIPDSSRRRKNRKIPTDGRKSNYAIEARNSVRFVGTR